MKCSACGTELLEGTYKCTACTKWNPPSRENLPSKWLSDVGEREIPKRLVSGPWDYVFGGGNKNDKIENGPEVKGHYGIKPGSVNIIGGGEGAGKSTLFLQIASSIADYDETVLYVATEESEEDVRDRAKRLKLPNQERIRIIEAIEGEGIQLDSIVHEFNPLLIILDSLPGFFADIQPERGLLLCKWFKRTGIATLISNHLNKEDEHGGYRSVLYAVDAVFTLEVLEDEEKSSPLQGLTKLHCPTKNRNGPTPREVYFRMTDNGLAWANVQT